MVTCDGLRWPGRARIPASRPNSLSAAAPLISVRRSRVHGRGVFAARRIRRGARVLEYVGERLDAAAVEARYPGRAAEDPHTLLFQIDENICIDASVGGNAARFINHSCDPNCEALQDGDRIFIHAVRSIAPGAELSYDYSLQIESGHSAARARRYACRCGSAKCRGTMLDPAIAKTARRRKPAPRLRTRT